MAQLFRVSLGLHSSCNAAARVTFRRQSHGAIAVSASTALRRLIAARMAARVSAGRATALSIDDSSLT